MPNDVKRNIKARKIYRKDNRVVNPGDSASQSLALLAELLALALLDMVMTVPRRRVPVNLPQLEINRIDEVAASGMLRRGSIRRRRGVAGAGGCCREEGSGLEGGAGGGVAGGGGLVAVGGIVIVIVVVVMLVGGGGGGGGGCGDALGGEGGEGEDDCDGCWCEGAGFEVYEVVPFEDGEDDCV